MIEEGNYWFEGNRKNWIFRWKINNKLFILSNKQQKGEENIILAQTAESYRKEFKNKLTSVDNELKKISN